MVHSSFAQKPQSSSRDPRLEALIQRALPGAEIVSVEGLGTDSGAEPEEGTTKGAGYGQVLKIQVSWNEKQEQLVLHTALSNAFGHDRRADRAAEMILAADTFGLIPRHVRVLDVGAFQNDGGFVSLRDTGEFYLLTSYTEGTPYAQDLRLIAERKASTPEDLVRVDRLVDYLLELHAQKVHNSVAYTRAIRDLLGSGEGIFGIVDSYPETGSEQLRVHLIRIEEQALAFRQRLKFRSSRLVRTHGDFHPFNVLFDSNAQVAVLDTSRGSVGDAADDVTCMAINFVFFALSDREAWARALRGLWLRFWQRYVERSGDAELLAVAAPFLAWRALVLASPVWYPDLAESARLRLLRFAESALVAPRFDPEQAEAVFSP